MLQRPKVRFLLIMAAASIAAVIALPQRFEMTVAAPTWLASWTPLSTTPQSVQFGSPAIDFRLFGRPIQHSFRLKQGLDIQGGMQVVLEADMSEIPEGDREQALESAREVILRRVDLYGISEPVVQTAQAGESYRLIVELPGVEDAAEALALVGQTAQLSFQLLEAAPPTEAMLLPENEEATTAAVIDEARVDGGMALTPTGLTGQQLQRSSVQFDPTTGEPLVALEFTSEGTSLFAQITQDNPGELLGIFLDDALIMAPQIQEPILAGQATITGDFTLDEAKNLSIQLNAGALPVPIQVLEQRTIGASLGQVSVQQSIRAGLIGLGLVMAFMILYYKMQGVLASFALVLYALFTLALYKIVGVTLTLPGIAGLLLSIGMAVDANILIFERMKEELRVGRPFTQAMELGFGRAWDSIKDANVATILTALVLINPLDFPFLPTSGVVRGFGITLFIGVLLGLLTGVVVTRTLVRLFLQPSNDAESEATGSSRTPELQLRLRGEE